MIYIYNKELEVIEQETGGRLRRFPAPRRPVAAPPQAQVTHSFI